MAAQNQRQFYHKLSEEDLDIDDNYKDPDYVGLHINDSDITDVRGSPKQKEKRHSVPRLRLSVREGCDDCLSPSALFLLLVCASIGYAPVGASVMWPNILALYSINGNTKTIFNTEIHLNSWQIDMAASMIFIGSMPGFIFAGWLVGRIGRRWSLLIGGIPTIIGSTLVALTANVYMLLIGRFFDGLTFGMICVSVRTYLVEIADKGIRGRAGILVNILMQIGSVLVLALGVIASWYYASMFMLGLMLFYCAVIVPFLPESPTYLAINGKEDEAYKILSRLRGPYSDLDSEVGELKKMNKIGEKQKKGYSGLLRLAILERFLILFGIFLLSNFSGVQVLKANITRILQSSGLALDGTVSAIIVTCVLFLGNSCQMLLVDKIGRRYCIIMSFSVVAVSYYSLGAYDMLMDYYSTEPVVDINTLLKDGFNTTRLYEGDVSGSSAGTYSWVPLACLMGAAFGQALGIGPLPSVLAPEYFPTDIRSQATSICNLIGGLQSFATIQLFSPMQTGLPAGGNYIVYALTATLGIPYTIFVVRETSGKTVG